MKLDLSKTFIYPEMKFKKYNIDIFDETMDMIYRHFKMDGDKVVDFLNKFMVMHFKEEMIIALRNTIIDENDKQLFTKDDEEVLKK